LDRRISEAELEIMEALWRRAPRTAAEVADDVSSDKDWSLQTVKTMLARLRDKGAIDHVKDGRRFLYSPLIARKDYVNGESQRFVDRLFGGKIMPLVAHLAERDALSDTDIEEIEQLIRDLKS
jgi:BlaI family penicillinase repressor